MSSFTPRSWKSQAEPQVERSAAPPVEPLPPRAAVETNNLPIANTAFIGRERDVAAVKALLAEHRLVTLVGSGGVGKTRLAVQVGSELLESYPDGVWLVDLSPIADPELVSSVIAQTLGMSQHEGHRVDESIPPWLKHKQLLLIFDNCEHVVETVAPIAHAILRTAPDVQIVATSRQPLEVGGEKITRVSSLDVPQRIVDLTPSAVIGFGAVALFVNRASLVDASFALTDDTAPIVADICRRLDGIPLAIELAAARVKVLSIPHLAERLDERFKLLTGGNRGALPRQKTLHALIDWSYDLLSGQEQLLFTRLGIFTSGFTLDAATNVCGNEGLGELDILDLLGSLTDKSLLVADTTIEHERYRLLESTAAYALEKLRDSGEHEMLARRHAEYYRDQAEAANERYGRGSTIAWIAPMELELHNFRTALTWALTQGNDAVVGGAIAGALERLWRDTGLTVEGRYWIERALEGVNETEHPRIAARLHLALSVLSNGRPRHDAASRSMHLYAIVGDAGGAARAQNRLAFALYQMGESDAAEATIEQALAASRACGDEVNVAGCLDSLASIEMGRRDVRARERYAQALAAYKELGNESGIAVALANIAELEFTEGHSERALRSISEALEILMGGKNAQLTAACYANRAAYCIALDDFAGASESAREALRAARQARIDLIIDIGLQHLALLAALGGDGLRAAPLVGYVDARFTELGMKRGPAEQWGYDKLLGTLRETLREDELAPLLAEGATWSEDRAVKEALRE